MPIRMNKQLMETRIQDALASKDKKIICQRVEICLGGLRTVRGGHGWANQLIDELGLEKFGAKKIAEPDESVRTRRKKIAK